MTTTAIIPQATNPRAALPALLDYKHLQACGMTRAMAYQLLNREDMPVVQIGVRKFMNRDRFFEWMDGQSARQA